MQNNEHSSGNNTPADTIYSPETFSFGDESFRRIVETIQDIIYVNDLHGNFLYMNPAGFKALGYSPEEFYLMNYEDIFPDEFKNQAFAFYSTQLKYGVETTYQEIPILCRDKSLLWFGQNVIRVEENGQVFFYGLARNITDRLKIEESLRESEEKYRSILETMEEGYFEVDLSGAFTLFNKSLCELIGRYTMEEFRHLNYRQVMDEESSRQVFHEFNKVFTTGKPCEIKFSVINKENAVRRLEAIISPIRDQENNTTGFRGIARDVTDKEKMLEDLKNSLTEIELKEKKYRLLAENSMDIIWVLDRETYKFTYLSPAIEKMRGLTVEEGMNETLDRVFPHEDIVRVLTVFNEELEKDKTGLYDPDRMITIEARQFKKDGQMIWVEIRTKFLRDENGEVIAAQGSTRDISHRKQVEQERDKFAEDLTAARLVQQEIIPQKPPSSDLVNIAFRYLPLDEVGGDYFTFVDFREYNSLGVFIGDVSGHGVPAALYTMTVKAVTDRLFRKYNLNPSRFMEVLNNEMHVAMSKQFLTGIYGFFSYGDDTNSVNFSFSKGGHPYPAFYSTEKRCAEYLKSSGRAMGFFEDEKFPNHNIILSKGDRIYLYTDGLIEVTDREQKIFGFERFLDLINDANSNYRPLEDTLDYIVKTVNAFNPHYDQEDDMVIIGIEVR
ncbi:MAG TPA: PAS domain S-box protein [Spirochaetota bacterium]|nr:PAS domain S-box protein [Spirochaetota bacterium]